MLSCVFNVSYIFLALSRIKWIKLCSFRMKPSTQHHFVYIIVLKWLDSKTTVICLKLSAKLLFYSFFKGFLALSRIRWLKLSLFCTKHGTQHYLVYIIVLKWLDSKTIFMYFKLRAKLRFECFLYFFGTVSYKVVQTWFVSHETWHRTLFGINYCVERVRIENYCHMLEITCYVFF